MGRSGPDVDVNDYHWVIDVKSRIEVPKTISKIVNKDVNIKWYIKAPGFGNPCSFWYACRLDHLDVMFDFDWEEADFASIMIHRWLEKMRRWGAKNPWKGVEGIGMVVLHRPRKPVGSSVVLMAQKDWLRVMEILEVI